MKNRRYSLKILYLRFIFIFYCNLNLYFKTGSVYYPRNEEGIFYRNLAELIEKEGNARNDFLIIADSSFVTF